MGKRPIKGLILGPEEDEGLPGWAWAGIIFFVLILLGQCSG